MDPEFSKEAKKAIKKSLLNQESGSMNEKLLTEHKDMYSFKGTYEELEEMVIQTIKTLAFLDPYKNSLRSMIQDVQEKMGEIFMEF